MSRVQNTSCVSERAMATSVSVQQVLSVHFVFRIYVTGRYFNIFLSYLTFLYARFLFLYFFLY